MWEIFGELKPDLNVYAQETRGLSIRRYDIEPQPEGYPVTPRLCDASRALVKKEGL